MKLKILLEVLVDADYRQKPEAIARRVREHATRMVEHSMFIARDVQVLGSKEIIDYPPSLEKRQVAMDGPEDIPTNIAVIARILQREPDYEVETLAILAIQGKYPVTMFESLEGHLCLEAHKVYAGAYNVRLFYDGFIAGEKAWHRKVMP